MQFELFACGFVTLGKAGYSGPVRDDRNGKVIGPRPGSRVVGWRRGASAEPRRVPAAGPSPVLTVTSKARDLARQMSAEHRALESGICAGQRGET